MAIFKAHVESHYTVIPNSTTQDKTLSFEARGVLALMLSLPENWEIHKSWLVEQSPSCGRDKLTRIMKELQNAGYIRKEIKQDGTGKLNGVDWLVYPTVQLENRTTENPLDGKPATIKETALEKKQTTNVEKVVSDKLDYSEIERIYNESLPEAANIAKMTPSRKKMIKKFFDDFDLNIVSFEKYLRYMATTDSCHWMFERRPKNDGSGQFWNKSKFEYFISEKCYLNVKENL